MIEYQRRPDRITALLVDLGNADAAAELVGGHLDDDGTLIVPLYGEGSEVPVAPGSYVWRDEMGPQVEAEPARFAAMWAEVTDGPTLRERIEKLEALVGGFGQGT